MIVLNFSRDWQSYAEKTIQPFYEKVDHLESVKWGYTDLIFYYEFFNEEYTKLWRYHSVFYVCRTYYLIETLFFITWSDFNATLAIQSLDCMYWSNYPNIEWIYYIFLTFHDWILLKIVRNIVKLVNFFDNFNENWAIAMHNSLVVV